MSIKDIQIFIYFENIYKCFIWGFNKIAALFPSMLKTTKLYKKFTNVSSVKTKKKGKINCLKTQYVFKT